MKLFKYTLILGTSALLFSNVAKQFLPLNIELSQEMAILK